MGPFSGNSQHRINILVSTHIFYGVRNPIKALFSVLDHYNMLQHATYTFQMVRHMPGPENCQIDYISSTSQCRIHILVSTHIFSRVRNPIKALLSVLDYYIMLKHIKNTFKMVHHVPKLQLIRRSCISWIWTIFSHIIDICCLWSKIKLLICVPIV